MINTIVQTIQCIWKDLLEPAAYLPYGVGAGIVFLVGWYLWPWYGYTDKKVHRLDKRQWILALWMVYGIVLLKVAFFSREPGSRAGIDLILFSTWNGGPQAHAYFIENILMFLPFGVLAPAGFSGMRSFRTCIWTGLLVSCALELIQLVTQRGYCQIDDIATNTLGTGIGWIIWKMTQQKRRRGESTSGST